MIRSWLKPFIPVFFLLSGFSHAESSSSSLKNSGREFLTKAAFFNLTLDMCSSWGEEPLPFLTKNSRTCYSAAHVFLKTLDIRSVSILIGSQRQYFSVVFPELVLRQLNEKKTTEFLKRLLQDRDLESLNVMSLVGSGHWRVYDRLKSWYPNPKDRLEILVSLFQDTSGVSAHVHWAAQMFQGDLKPSPTQAENLNLLSKILEMNSTYGIGYVPSFDLPSYHEYVPAYLALRMKEQNIPEWAIFPYAYGFNFFYESYSAIKKSLIQKDGISRQKTLKYINFDDVYPGYRGVYNVLQLQTRGIPYWETSEAFKESFLMDPDHFHSNIVKMLKKKNSL